MGETENKTRLDFSLPQGTVAFLMTDVEGSTRMWESNPEAMRVSVARLEDLLGESISTCGGRLPRDQGEGDSLVAVFPMPSDAVACAIRLQVAIDREPWPDNLDMKVRMAVHVGEAESRAGNYYGPSLHRCARLRDLAHGGQILVSETTYQMIRDQIPRGVLVRDLGIQALRDLKQPEHVYQIGDDSLPQEYPPLRSPTPGGSTNLPNQLTTFVGRKSALAEIPEAISKARLVTLTGAGGSGKTRLAQEVGARILDRFADGVWFVELASVPVGGLVGQATAAVFALREQSGRSIEETLSEHLRDKQALLIFDNCEHLIDDAAALASTLLKSCREIRIIATSREPLGIPGETNWVVPPLTHPTAKDSSLKLLMQYEAPLLFVDRASSGSGRFELSELNADAVAEICERLDGSPLGIELTTAWLSVLTPQQISERLRDRLPMLPGRSRTGPARHQTLHATVDWSFELLPADEQKLFYMLSVFVSPFSLKAAEFVCSGKDLDEAEILDLLSGLVNKSLIQSENVAGESRYSMLQTIRDYGVEKLRESGDEDWVRSNHLGWFASVAQEAAGEMRGQKQGRWLDQLELEHEDLRAAFAWATDNSHAIESLRLASDLWMFWFVRGYLSQGRDLLEQAIEKAPDAPDELKARAMYALGVLAQNQGDIARAGVLFENCLAIYRRVGDSKGISTALIALGNAADRHGEYEKADGYFQEALALRREAGDRQGMSTPLLNLGNVSFRRGNFEEARRYYEESLSLKRESGDEVGMASALHNLSAVLEHLGESEEAARLEAQALEMRRKLGDKRGIGASLHSLAEIAKEAGELDRAKEMFGESMELLHGMGDLQGVAQCLLGFAEVALQGEEFELAVKLYSAFEKIRDEIGLSIAEMDQQVYSDELARLRDALGEHRYQELWEEGLVLELDDAVSMALSMRSAR